MCGRYYVDDETAREIEQIVRRVSDKLLSQKQDVYPSATANVIIGKDCQFQAKQHRWGFPHFDSNKSGVIFNARAETVLDKKMFRESVLERRCVIPAAGFYEWNQNKDKYFFSALNQKILLFAGFYKQFENEHRFVILTAAANESMQCIHHRMPLIMELDDWLFQREAVAHFLAKKPKQLDKQIQGQMTLFE